MHQQIEEDLLQLALRPQDEQRLARGKILDADARRLPIALAEFDQVVEQRGDRNRARFHLLGGGE